MYRWEVSREIMEKYMKLLLSSTYVGSINLKKTAMAHTQQAHSLCRMMPLYKKTLDCFHSLKNVPGSPPIVINLDKGMRQDPNFMLLNHLKSITLKTESLMKINNTIQIKKLTKFLKKYFPQIKFCFCLVILDQMKLWKDWQHIFDFSHILWHFSKIILLNTS